MRALESYQAVGGKSSLEALREPQSQDFQFDLGMQALTLTGPLTLPLQNFLDLIMNPW